ncbi:MAG: GNAT family N-acetyltransferase [Candidatus Odinarchaeota archaeon]
MVVKFRQAKEEDREKISELIKYAYDIPEFYLEQMKKWFDVIYKEHYIGIENGKLVTTLRCIPLQQNIRGVFKPMGGIGMIATAPEFRRKGYVKDLTLIFPKKDQIIN